MDILFWSGGKDSYLALEFYKKERHEEKLKLLTTYREDTDVVPHQNIAIEDIKQQARRLDLELILVALPKDCPNETYLEHIQKALKNREENIDALVFGDWHLRDIREWREEVFTGMGYNCLFPIWKKSLHDLLPVLTLKPVEVTISAVKDEYQKFISIGEPYNQRFVQQLPAEIDPMGENGEFHTKVTIQPFDDIEPSGQPLY